MRAYIRLPLPFAVLVSTLAGCGSGTDSGFPLAMRRKLGFDAPLSSGFDSAPIPGVDSGFAAWKQARARRRFGPGGRLELRRRFRLDAGSSTGADSAFDTGGSTGWTRARHPIRAWGGLRLGFRRESGHRHGGRFELRRKGGDRFGCRFGIRRQSGRGADSGPPLASVITQAD